MSGSECNAIIDNYNEQYKNGWEMTRYIGYVIAAVNNKKIKKPQDLVRFEWDDDIKKEKILSKEERMRQEQEMLDWIKDKKNRE